jgi:hypothetical protein
MLCTFCGTENHQEHKFCGMCGVRLERRQTDRRVAASCISLKCSSCNHVNDAGLKFCGMCGARVERRMQERRASGDGPRAAAIANAQLPTPDSRITGTRLMAEPTKRSDDVLVALPRRGEPAIFRNDPVSESIPPPKIASVRESPLREPLARGSSVKESSARDRRIPAKESNISGPSFLGLNSQQSGNDVEYLLEDEPTGGGLRKFILLLILAAIVGLAFVQWRSSLKANPKPAPAKTDPAVPGTAPQGDSQPPSSSITTPATDDASKTAAAATSDPDAVAASESKDKTAEPAVPATDTNTAAPAPAATDAPADKKPISNAAPPTTDAKPAEETRLADYKPSPSLIRAQQYLRGRGVPQNCEQGLLYLHAATDKSDPGAAIQMAALYSSGVCVKQDRVMAYRWFNSAHELQPGNVWIQKNMDQLWAQMSSQERRLSGY